MVSVSAVGIGFYINGGEGKKRAIIDPQNPTYFAYFSIKLNVHSINHNNNKNKKTSKIKFQSPSLIQSRMKFLEKN
jgi:hypothetical protein